MIKVFHPSEGQADFISSNGDVVIQPLRALVTKVDNGDYYLELETSLDYIDYLKPQNIIVVDLPQGAQGFRIIAPVETTRTKIKIKAYHLYYDTNNYIIADSYVVNKNCDQALKYLNNHTDTESPFTMSSDIEDINSYRCVRKSLNEAISVILDRWGGHLVRDNFKISVKENIGEDLGVTIQYRKNLKEITVSEDWSAVCTKLLPVGVNGLLLDDLYVYAQDQYRIPFTRVLSFDQSNIVKEDYETEEEYIEACKVDLLKKARDYLKVSQYPKINYTVTANIDNISDIGDIVKVYDERLGVDLTARVISFVYDAILGKYTQVQFGTMTDSLSGLLSGISGQINTAISESQQSLIIDMTDAINTAVAQIWDELTDSYTIIDGDKILIVDNLPSSSAVNVIKIDQNGVSISHNGVTGSFESVFSIAGEMNFNNFSVVNLTLSMIAGGVLALGGNNNIRGSIEIYNGSEPASKIGEIGKNGVKIINSDGSYYLLDNNGLSGFDSSDNLKARFSISQLLADDKDIIGDLYFKAGDNYIASKKIVTGFIDSTASIIRFTYPLPKITGGLSVLFNDLKINVFVSSGGDLFGPYTPQGYDILSDQTLTVAVEETGDNYLTISITRSSPFVTTGSAPVCLSVESLDIDFN
jgi:phage minor structural protein